MNWIHVLGYALLFISLGVLALVVIVAVGKMLAPSVVAAMDVEPTPEDEPDDSERETNPANPSWDALAKHGALSADRPLPCYGPPPAIPGAPHPRHAQTGAKAWLADVWAQTVEIVRQHTRPVMEGDKPEVSEGWEQGHLGELDAMHDPEPIEPQDEPAEDDPDVDGPDCEAGPVADERTEDDVEQDQEQAPEVPQVESEPERELLAAALYNETTQNRTVSRFDPEWLRSGMNTGDTGRLPKMTPELEAAMAATDERGRTAVWA
jgi:hypothetical protein